MVEKTGTLNIPTAPIFRPLLDQARYKAAYGGRGSAKSHFFGEMLVEECVMVPGTRAVCLREVQRTLKESCKFLLESKIQSFGLGKLFKVWHDRIETPGDGTIIFNGMQDHTAESIKSLEGFRIAYIEEGQNFSERSLELLRPTIRLPESQIWAGWNPTRKIDAIDKFFRINPPSNAIVVRTNWRDNPWWNDVLEKERLHDLEHYAERYDHIWEGEYAKAFSGAYFAKLLAKAEQEGRITALAVDPLLPLRAYWDIGGAGAKADALCIWVCQFVGDRILVLDYCEGVGQVLAFYVNWLRKHDYERAECVLPHDGINTNNITGKTYKAHLQDAGFSVTVVPNQGPGAAAMRIEAIRRLGSRLWFNAKTTEAGRDALGFYHERRDSQRNIGLGPDHDWSSHAADAFGMMAVTYVEPVSSAKFWRKLDFQPVAVA